MPLESCEKHDTDCYTFFSPQLSGQAMMMLAVVATGGLMPAV